MKITYIILILTALAVAGCRSLRKPATEKTQPPLTSAAEITEEASEHVWDFRDATTWLLGEINPAQLLSQPHGSWYHDGYAEYEPDAKIMAELKGIDISGYDITIVLGTWCPDSRREVPRFMKIIDLWGFPPERIKLIGVDINKVAPLADYAALGIERVPTFIFHEKNYEKGRIIEVPVTSLEQDIRDILTGNQRQLNN